MATISLHWLSSAVCETTSKALECLQEWMTDYCYWYIRVHIRILNKKILQNERYPEKGLWHYALEIRRTIVVQYTDNYGAAGRETLRQHICRYWCRDGCTESKSREAISLITRSCLAEAYRSSITPLTYQCMAVYTEVYTEDIKITMLPRIYQHKLPVLSTEKSFTTARIKNI